MKGKDFNLFSPAIQISKKNITVKKNNLCMGKTKHIMRMFRKETVWFRPPIDRVYSPRILFIYGIKIYTGLF